mmetsp:Transcript_26906/g.53884  ORF Transcript_26906/g.53884 Transcript_26906/m.53884 type:complete len:255 (+) Transcript_26906:545-1309(+)
MRANRVEVNRRGALRPVIQQCEQALVHLFRIVVPRQVVHASPEGTLNRVRQVVGARVCEDGQEGCGEGHRVVDEDVRRRHHRDQAMSQQQHGQQLGVWVGHGRLQDRPQIYEVMSPGIQLRQQHGQQVGRPFERAVAVRVPREGLQPPQDHLDPVRHLVEEAEALEIHAFVVDHLLAVFRPLEVVQRCAKHHAREPHCSMLKLVYVLLLLPGRGAQRERHPDRVGPPALDLVHPGRALPIALKRLVDTEGHDRA